MNITSQKVNPRIILQKIIEKSLNSFLVTLEDKSKQEMIDLQCLKESSEEILCKYKYIYIILLHS